MTTTAVDDQFAPEPIQELEQKHHDKIVGIIAEKIEAERCPAPHGWKLVPVEPTEDMTAAGFEALMAWDVRTGDDMGIEDTYSAMLAAAPTPPAQASGQAAPSDEEIDAIAASMPDGAGGMLKQWGYRQFARALLARYGAQPAAGEEIERKDVEIARLREALELAYEAMNYMGDILNNMDAVEEEDEDATAPAFEAVRAALAAPAAAMTDLRATCGNCGRAAGEHYDGMACEPFGDLGGGPLFKSAAATVPSDEEIISLAYDCNALPEVITDESLKLFSRALLARYGQSAADEIEGLRAHVALLKTALAQAERENDELRRAQPAAATVTTDAQAIRDAALEEAAGVLDAAWGEHAANYATGKDSWSEGAMDALDVGAQNIRRLKGNSHE